MKKLLFMFFIVNISFSQSNVQNELVVRNTSLYLAHRKTSPEVTEGKEFFKPYLAFYNKDSNSYDDLLMDSFVFSDLSIGMIGWFDSEIQDFYLKNVFQRTKIPIRRNNGVGQFGVINDSKTSALSYKATKSFENSVTLYFDAKAITPPSTDDIIDELIIGIEYFNSNDEEIKSFPNHDFSDYIDMFYYNINIDTDMIQNDYTNITKALNFPPSTVSYRIHIMNWGLGSISEIEIDNVSLITNIGAQKIDSLDQTFDFIDISTNWEYNLEIKQGNYLFENRDALIDQLNDANNDLSILNMPTTKLILMIPTLNMDNYDTQAKKDQLIKDLSNYIDQIQDSFTNWQSNVSDPKVEILGLYYFEEGINANNNNVSFINEIFSPTKTKLHSEGWKLFGSPYHKFGGCETTSSYDTLPIELFDICWQQPNSFYTSHWGELQGNTDRELLKKANKFSSTQNLNINIENRVLAEGEHYGRINDYFDYGDKYGFTNYSKLYYDDSGAHYVNAKSDNPNERIDYENLYKYIQKSKKGEVINNKFEILDEDNPSKLHHWEGNYSVKKNDFSFNKYRELEFITNTSTNLYSDFIPINDVEEYKMTFQARESISDWTPNSALVGVRFFDNSGYQITGLNLNTTNLEEFSEYLDSYYKYFSTTDSFINYSIEFIAPPNAVNFQFFLRKWRTADIEWKSIKFYNANEIEKSRIIYKNNISSFLKIENDQQRGNNSLKLTLNKFAEIKERISITPNIDYTIKVSAKEELPYIDNRNNKALIGIEMFDAQGNEIDRTLGDFIYSSILGMRFRYLSVNQTWNEFSKTFQFANDVASIKIYLRNWQYNNTVYIDNLSFELDNSPNLTRTINDDNQLLRDNWNEKLPLTISENNSSFYNDFVDVSNISNLDFSALVRGSGSYPADKDLLAIEFFDENYNILLKNDIIPNNTNLIYSDYWDYWWPNYLTIDFIPCGDFILQNSKTPEAPQPAWYDNQWELYEKNIVIPDEASYIKVFFHKVTLENEYLVLNPQLIESIGGIKRNNELTPTKEENAEIIGNKINNFENHILIFPNPSENNISIKFTDNSPTLIDYTVFDIQGKLVIKGTLKHNFKLNISSLTTGLYFIKIKDANNIYNKKFIKI